MAKIERWYQTAYQLQTAGDLAAAEPLYRRVLEKQPRHAEALYLLGSLYAQQGRYADALPLLDRALAVRPQFTEAYNNRAVALKELGRFDEALAAYDAAIARRPDYAEAYNNRGIVLQALGRWEEAAESYCQAHAANPNYTEPLNNLGIVLKDKGKLAESETVFRQALTINPKSSDLLNNLGLTLMTQARFEEALACHDEALAVRPDFPQAYNSRGASLVAMGRFEEARDGYARALLLKPEYEDVRCNIALSYLSENRIPEALAAFDNVLAQNPEMLSARWNRSLTLLVGGDLARGWAEYEYRFRHKRVTPHISTQPIWDGSPLAGRTILVHAEQGFGDSLNFVRYLPLIRAAGGRVLFECPLALHPLMAGCDGIDRLLPPHMLSTDGVEPHDFQIPLLSLPGLFRTTEETIPGDVPYISVPDDRREAWRVRLDDICRSLGTSGTGLKVGLVWGGHPNHTNDHNRSCPLAEFGPLAAVPGVTFFSLQKGPAAAQAADPPRGMTLVDLGPALGDFADTAAVIEQLDLVISVDTSVVHLAGALGKPVWTLLPFCPDWRWQLEREDSPWYPTMRLFRQSQPRQWTPVLHRIGDELGRLAGASALGEEHAAHLVKLGETCFATGDLAEASRCFTQALAAVPGHPRAQNNLAVLAFQESRFDDAIVLLSAILTQSPGQTSALENMARCWAAKGDDTQALVWWQKTLETVPQNSAVWNALAQCCVRRQDWAAAREAFQQSYTLDGSQEGVREILAELDTMLAPRPTHLVSVLIPCYKQAHLLPEAVESVVAQTYPHWEIVIVNDGSPDDTTAVANSLIARYPEHRIRLVEKANAGLSAARNTGLRHISGTYVLPLDSDDALHPQMLEKTAWALDTHPEASVAYTHIQLFGDKSEVCPCGPFDAEAEMQTNRLAYCSLMRRSMVEELGGYAEDAVAYEDWDFWLSAMERGHQGVLVPEPLFRYRQSATSKLMEDNRRREYFVARLVLRHTALYGPGRSAEAAQIVSGYDRMSDDSGSGPLVSVIIPCYKQAQYLPEAIATLIAQTYTAWEAVIVNDGSPDDTSTVAQALIAAHPDRRIRLVEKANGGLSSARNAGIRASQGEYILPLDADDALHPQMLEKTVTVLLSHPNDAVAYTHIQHFGAQEDVWHAGPFTSDAMAEDNRLVCTALYKREIFDAVGGYAEDMPAYEDWDFWLSALERGYSGRLVPEPLFRYRKARTSMLTGANARRARLTAHVVTRHPQLYGPARVAQARAGLLKWAAEDAQRDEALSLVVAGPGPRPRVLVAAAFFYPHVGGEERFAEDLAIRLQDAGNDVEIITRPDAERTSDEHRGLHIHSCVGDAGEYFGLLLRRRHYDAVLIIGPPHSVFMTAAQHLTADGPRIITIPCITPQGYSDVHSKTQLRFAMEAMAERAEVTVCSSHKGYDARLFAELGIGSVYIPNAVHRNEPDGDFRERYGIPADAPMVLMVGNLRGEKNHAGLLNLLRDRPGDWRLVMIGCPFEYSPHVATHVGHLAALDPRVTLIPGAPPRTIAAAMAAADLLVLPSFADATPLVLIEAMSHRLPWLATPECGSAHDHAGGLVLPVPDFAPAIDFLLADADTRHTLGEAGHAHWQTCYRYDITGLRYTALVGGADSLPPLEAPAEALVQTRDAVEAFRTWQACQKPEPAQQAAISVIIRAPQDVQPLRRALASLDKQTLPDWSYEIIVVEDGSRPGLRPYWAKPQTKHAIVQQRTAQTGLAAVRNAGLLRARGEIVLFLDEAIALTPDFLEKHLRAHQTQTAASVGMSSRLVLAQSDSEKITAHLIGRMPGFGNPEQALRSADSRNVTEFSTHGTSLKRGFLLHYGLFDTTAPDAAVDAELAWRLTNDGLRLVEAEGVTVEHSGPRSWSEFCQRQAEQGRAAAWLCRHYAAPAIPFWLGVANAHQRLPDLAPAWQKTADIPETLRALDKAGWNTLSQDPSWNETTFPALQSLRHIAAEYHLLSGYTQALAEFEAQDRRESATISDGPLVSIVVTSYNYGRYLTEAVESVVAQTYLNWEMVIVNDGSPDDTQQVAEALITAHPDRKIRLISQTNSGHAAHARNRGLAEVNGQYMLCLDADDVLEPTFIAESVALLQANPHLSIAYTDQERFYDDGTTERFFAGDYAVEHLIQYLPFGACSLFRRSTWIEAGPYKPVGYEDWDFWLACAERGHRGRRIPKPLFRYRKHNEGKYAQDVARGLTHKAYLVHNHPALFDDTAQRWARGVVLGDQWLALADKPKPTARVSVLLTTNGDDTAGLTGSLTSLFAQACTDRELTLIHTGHGDLSAALRSFGSDPRVTVLRAPETVTVGDAYNRGLRVSTGRYVAYLPTGITWAPSHLQALAGFLESTGEHAAYTDTTEATAPHFDYRQILVNDTIPTGALMHERLCLDRTGPFDPTLPVHADWDLSIRLSRFFDIVHLPQATLNAGKPPVNTAAMELCALETIYRRYAAAAQSDSRLAVAQQALLQQIREQAAQADTYERELVDAERRVADGDGAGAKARLHHLLEQAPRDTRVWNDLGVIAWQEGEKTQALSHFLQALQIAPDDRATVLNCTDALHALGQPEEAALLLAAFVRRHPDDSEAAQMWERLSPPAQRQLVAA
jgi:glycosyltransferase involved in cell wall biosynthesis/Flp pilus assembly protein TadD